MGSAFVTGPFFLSVFYIKRSIRNTQKQAPSDPRILNKTQIVNLNAIMLCHTCDTSGRTTICPWSKLGLH